MRCAIRAEKEFRVAAGCDFNEFLAMNLAFQYREAVVVRPETALEECIAAQQQVVNSNCGGDIARGIKGKFHRLLGGDMFEHDAQLRKSLCDRNQHPLEKDFFPVEYIDLRVRDFTVHQ